MIEVKQLTGSLDLDSSPYKIGKEDYAYGLNITKDAIEGSNDVAVTNIVGNQIVNNPYLNKYYQNTQSYSLYAVVWNNGDNTQTIRVTFTGVSAVAVNIEYYNGSVWTQITSNSGASSQLIGSFPLGDFQYRFGVFQVAPPLETYYSLTETTTTDICIGAKQNYPTMIYMVWNSIGYHQVLEFDIDTRDIVPIFRNLIDSNYTDVLGFTQNNKINNINIYNREEGNLLYFLDSLDRPTYMNIERMKNREYVPVTREILDAQVAPPLVPPTGIYANDIVRRVNNCRNKLFRFKYRWVYDDNQKSVYSPISAVPLPLNILDPIYTNDVTNNNNITVQLYSGEQNVKAIELCVSICNKTNEWSDFAEVKSFNKTEESIDDSSIFSYQFYNDSTYPTIDIAESLLLYDYLPPKAKAQEMPNGNVLMYGAITEGYDRDTEMNVDVVVNTISASGGGEGTLSGVNTNIIPIIRFWSTIFSGTAATGTIILIRLKKQSDDTFVTAATYTTLEGDNLDSIGIGVSASGVSLGIFSDIDPVTAGVLYSFNTTYYNQIFLTITPPSLTTDDNSQAVWKWSTERSIGMVYFDNKGRTNGIVYNTKVSFPAYSETAGDVNIPNVNIKIYNQPPIWAYSYQILFTKESTSYIFWQTIDAVEDTDFIYFDVTNFITNAAKEPTTSTVLSYTFQDGDRMRLIRNQVDDTVYDYTYDAEVVGLVLTPTVNGTQLNVPTNRTFLKIRNVAPFDTVNVVADKTFVIEIYRVSQQVPNEENQVFYELGVQYPILNPTESDRIHAGQVTDQSTNYVTPAEINISNGDSYFRLRTIFASSALTSSSYASFYCQDRNFLDIYTSAVNSIDGRPNQIDINAREAYYSTLVRFGQAYQPNTNINGFNRFFPNDFDEYDYTYGDIVRFKTRDRFIRIFQKYKVGVVPLFNQISRNADGTALEVVTSKLLNPIQYYVGDCGIGEQAESLASHDFADYFTTNVRGVIARVSNDGITFLSILKKVNSWATEELPQRIGNAKVYGVFDIRLNKYIIALEAVDENYPQVTLSYDEERNGFESFLSLYPEMMVGLGTLLISFKNGELYTHDSDSYNTFFGTTYDSEITPVFNQNTLEKKTYMAISEVASEVWDCPEITTSLNSYGTTKQQSNLVEEDFETKEGVHHAGFLRDTNSIGGLIEGNSLKGNFLTIKFRKENPTNLVTLDILSLEYKDSALTAK